MSKLFILLLLSLFTKQLHAQNPRKELPVGINGHLGGPGIMLGASIDAFVTPAINLEAGAGFSWLGKNYFGGIKYHTESESNSNWSLFGGAMIIAAPIDYGSSESKYSGVVYLPIGIQYIADRGFTFGFEFAGIIDKDLAIVSNHFSGWFGIKLGIHFSIKDNLPKPEKRKSTYKDENFEHHLD